MQRGSFYKRHRRLPYIYKFAKSVIEIIVTDCFEAGKGGVIFLKEFGLCSMNWSSGLVDAVDHLKWAKSEEFGFHPMKPFSNLSLSF